MLTNPKLSTMVCVGELDTRIDLKLAFEMIVIDDIITGCKYDNNRKGEISATKSFYNQMTLIVKTPSKKVNLKVFSNGKVQVSGVKEIDQAKEAVTIFIQKVCTIFGSNDVTLHKDFKTGLICDQELNVFGNGNCIGKINEEGQITIHGNLVEPFVDSTKATLFRTLEYTTKEKQIYNYEGEQVGTSSIDFIRKRKNFSLKNTVLKESVLYSKWGNELGKEIITFTTKENKPFIEKIQVSFSVLSNRSPTLKMSIVNINANVCMTEVSSINRNNLSTILRKLGIWTDYDPCGYPGVKAAMYILEDGTIGNCSHGLNGRKCKFCIKSSVVFFQSSKILISGCRSLEQVNKVREFVSNILNDNLEELTATAILSSLNDSYPVITAMERVSIYDLL